MDIYEGVRDNNNRILLKVTNISSEVKKFLDVDAINVINLKLSMLNLVTFVFVIRCIFQKNIEHLYLSMLLCFFNSIKISSFFRLFYFRISLLGSYLLTLLLDCIVIKAMENILFVDFIKKYYLNNDTSFEAKITYEYQQRLYLWIYFLHLNITLRICCYLHKNNVNCILSITMSLILFITLIIFYIGLKQRQLKIILGGVIQLILAISIELNSILRYKCNSCFIITKELDTIIILGFILYYAIMYIQKI